MFPAYNLRSQSNHSDKTEQEWLCNSSYSPSNNEIISNTQEKVLDTDKEVTEVKVKKKYSKKKNIKDKKKFIPPSSSFEVPESDSIRSYLNKKTFIEETGLSFERAFRIDSKCDPENIHYEHLEQKNIAKYKLYPEIPVGLTAQLQALWPKSSAVNTEKVFPRYFNKKALTLLKSISSCEKIQPLKDTLASNSNLQFIPVSSINAEKVLFKNFSKGSFDGISSSWKQELPKNSTSKEVPEELNLHSEHRDKTIFFNKKLSEFPHDVQLWLDFLDFQDELYSSERTESKNESLSENALIEKKIVILDKALSHNPKCVKLNVLKLNLCRSVWTLDKLIKSWDELMFLNIHNVDLWQEYFIFHLTNMTYFTESRISRIYSKCFSTLSDLSEGITYTHGAPSDIVPRMLDIFSQMCFVLKSCGYMEKAVGAFQALIELNIFGDKTIETLPISEKISFLEPYWDFGTARFGETGSIGWAATIYEKQFIFDDTESDLSDTEDEILNSGLSESKTWLKFEQLRALHYWLPWRPKPEDDDDYIEDDQRKISFDTVSQFLFRVSEEEHKFLLLLHFINFLGFNPHNFGCTFFTKSTKFCCVDIFDFSLISFTLKNTFFTKTDDPLCFVPEEKTKHKYEFMNNVFSQALSKFSRKYRLFILSMHLNFYRECAASNNNTFIKLDEVKKIIKSTLKESENRNCLRLWLEYIKVESVSSEGKAKKTFETLVASSCQTVSEGAMTNKELWYFVRSYLDQCFGVQSHSFIDTKILSQNEVISLLVCVACKENYTNSSVEFLKPVYILKAVSNFKNFLLQELQSIQIADFAFCPCIDPDSYSIFDCAKCFAYFQYFTKGIDAAMNAFKYVSDHLETNYCKNNKRFILEQFTILQADLLNFHTWNSNASLKPLQLFMEESVSMYPSCSKLLYYLIKIKSASSVVGPTRRFFAKILKKTHELQPNVLIFVIASELLILNSIVDQQSCVTDPYLSYVDESLGQGIKWKIRSLYEKALKLQSCCCVPILWRSYLKFEVLNGELDKAKSIYYRALQNCCWCKDLLMDGVEYFPDNYEQAIDFMKEKGLRIRSPIEEIMLLRLYL